MQLWRLGALCLLLLALFVHRTAPASERLQRYRRVSDASCPDPGTPRHSLRQPQELRPFSEREVVSYACNLGYRLQGSPQLICRHGQGTASWSASVPQCIATGEEYSLVAWKMLLSCSSACVAGCGGRPTFELRGVIWEGGRETEACCLSIMSVALDFP
jgi:hypothetical protein